MTPDDLLDAESTIICFAQRKRFPQEIATLSAGKGDVKRESTINKLDPTLEDVVLRVGGRLSRASGGHETSHDSVQRPTCVLF